MRALVLAVVAAAAAAAIGVAGAMIPPDPLPTSHGPVISRHPLLRAGPYVYPVYGPARQRLTGRALGAAGVDVIGELGQPLVACASGTLFGVGWTRAAGNRLFLRDGRGNVFSYSHLSAFAAAAFTGAHVRAGQVIGFVGRTGRVEGPRYRLHFEVHPVSLLYLGPAGAVDPRGYLRKWTRVRDLPLTAAAGWAPQVHGTARAARPAAMLVSATDISSADGLDPASLRRALRMP
jgi:murein DD-endopeptidase MepM/ murein hydrolase activator NlpD